MVRIGAAGRRAAGSVRMCHNRLRQEGKKGRSAPAGLECDEAESVRVPRYCLEPLSQTDQSLCNRLGSDFALPQQELSNQNVEGRWQKAAQTAAAMTQAHEGAGSRPASPEASTDGPAGGAEKTVGRSPHRKRRGDHGEIHVGSHPMFSSWIDRCIV